MHSIGNLLLSMSLVRGKGEGGFLEKQHAGSWTGVAETDCTCLALCPPWHPGLARRARMRVLLPLLWLCHLRSAPSVIVVALPCSTKLP